jgi:hypothetical protein
MVAAVVASTSLAVASLVGLVLLSAAPVGRAAKARGSRLRAVRRGLEAGAIVALLAGLQVIGGLTPLTALFVVLSFAVAEYVLSAGAAPSR